MQQLETNERGQIHFRHITCADSAFVLEGYALLQEAIGVESVENLGSFLQTVSPETDHYAVPELVCGLVGDEMVGIIVGVYLRRLNMGFIAYSGVRESFRRRGIYTSMKTLLVEGFNQESLDSTGVRIAYLVSELEGDGWLYGKYVGDWGGYALPCDYEQPEAQGLREKQMRLVVQPMACQPLPDTEQVVEIIREVYQRIYRIPNVDDSPAYHRVIASINR